jgi:hypothetical protein
VAQLSSPIKDSSHSQGQSSLANSLLSSPGKPKKAP